jgi:hypothetical protein
MLDLKQKIERLLREQDEFDEKISSLDMTLAEALAHQSLDGDPVRRANNAAIREMFTSLADLLYGLGQVSARLEDAQALAGEIRRSDVASGLVGARVRVARGGMAGGGG